MGYAYDVSGPSQQVASVYDHSGRLLYEATTTGANPDRIFQSGFEPAPPPTSATKYVYLGSHPDRQGGTAMALTFDGRGNLKQKGSGTAATHYTFDDASLLTSIVNGGSTWEYSYDALGYRSTTASPAWNVVSVYDHTGRLLYETETANGVPDRIFQSGFEPPAVATFQNKYVYLGTHLLAVERKTGGTTQLSYQHTDALGTPVAQTDASRNLLGTSTYLPYGGLYASTGIGNLTGPGYANQYVDDTGLIYMHARYYDPQLRRFIGPDPDPVDAGTALNFNRYAYAYNSPFAKYDPSGRCGTDIPDQEDVAGQCGGDSSSSSSLPSAGDVLQGIDSAMVAMGPVGVEVSGVERAGVAAAEEVAAAAPAVIEDVEAGIAAFEEVAGIARSSQLGKEGEAAVRSAYDIGEKVAIQVGENARVPDGINRGLQTLSEVKNTAYQGWTSQLRDYSAYAQEQGWTFNLYIRPGARLSQPLLNARDAGIVNILDIPFLQ